MTRNSHRKIISSEKDAWKVLLIIWRFKRDGNVRLSIHRFDKVVTETTRWEWTVEERHTSGDRVFGGVASYCL